MPSSLGLKRSEETRKRLSESHKGNKVSHSIETRKKISDSLKGHSVSILVKEKFNMRGKAHSEETKLKMSQSSLGKKKSKEHCENISKGKLKIKEKTYA